MKIRQAIQLAISVWPFISAFLVLAKAVQSAADPMSPGGRQIAHEERPAINAAFWRAYDDVVVR